MIFMLCLIFVGLFLTWFFEESSWEEDREMMRLIKESRVRENSRSWSRNFYGQRGWNPPIQKRKFFRRIPNQFE